VCSPKFTRKHAYHTADDEHARALEEQWIDSMDNVNTASLSSASSQSLILRGIVIGFFFPIIPFFFLRETKAAVFWEEWGECHIFVSLFLYLRIPRNHVLTGTLDGVHK
jgi:hypothetical protein